MRQTKCRYMKHSIALLSLAALFCFVSPAIAQSAQTQDHDTTSRELANFDRFMDGHPEIAEQVRKDPSLVRNQQFVENHPDLQRYLDQHPNVREEISENPNSFMRQEKRFDGQETRKELGNLDRFMDTHPEIAEQLRKDPTLVNNKEFVSHHPALQEFLQSHSGVAQELRENPNAFMGQEQRFDQREINPNRDAMRWQMGNLDQFLDSHPEIAEQLRKDPSLVNNKEFVDKHPALQTYLQQHPGVHEEFSENPDAFMRREQRFDRQEDGLDHDTTRGQLSSADRFFDTHPEIAEQLRKDPSLVNNKEFVKSHPDLQTYLQQHPGVNQEISENPNAFMRQEQRFDRQEDLGRNGAGFGDERDRREMAGFGEFLGAHANIAAQISKDPSLLNNKEYMENHPELEEYLKAHPAVQEEAKANPQAFLQSAQQASKPVPKTSTLQKSPTKQQ
jgi:hypothetical protein